MVGIVAAVVILVGGCVALLAGNIDAADDELVSVATSTPAAENAAEGDTGADPADEAPDPAATGGEEIDDIVSCLRTDPETIVLEVVNNSPKTSSYILTVGFFDDAGTRLADEPMFLNYLRPGGTSHRGAVHLRGAGHGL